MLLLGERPDLGWGSLDVVSLVFDMNHLFESYVAVQLRRVAGVNVQTQARASFWRSDDGAWRILKPDAVATVRATGDVVVLDTKWKELRDERPSDDDLRQLYSYAETLEARRSYLVYPSVDAAAVIRGGSFERGGRRAGTARIALMPERRPLSANVTETSAPRSLVKRASG